MSITQLMVDSYLGIPIVTRCCSTFSVLLALAVHLDLIDKFDLYFNPWLAFGQLQLWRLLTCFFYIGKIDVFFIFNILYPYRYLYYLEIGDFAERTDELILMFGFGMSSLLFLGYLTTAVWLDQSFGLFILYVWSRRNPEVRMELFGLGICQAAYIPLIFLLLSFLFGDVRSDVLGFVVGHAYYHARYVFSTQSNGFQIFTSPQFLMRLFRPPPASLIDEVIDETSAMEVRPELQDASTSTYHDANATTSQNYTPAENLSQTTTVSQES